MGETDVKKIERVLKKVNTAYKTLTTVILANIIVMLGVVWWASNIDTRVDSVEKKCNKNEVALKDKVDYEGMPWQYNEYHTNYMWAIMWGQEPPDPPYNTRGVAPNL